MYDFDDEKNKNIIEPSKIVKIHLFSFFIEQFCFINLMCTSTTGQYKSCYFIFFFF